MATGPITVQQFENNVTERMKNGLSASKMVAIMTEYGSFANRPADMKAVGDWLWTQDWRLGDAINVGLADAYQVAYGDKPEEFGKVFGVAAFEHFKNQGGKIEPR